MKKYIQWYTAAVTALVICAVNCSNIMAENNTDIKEKAYSSEHITEEYEGDDGSLCIDADLNIPSETIYTGTLTFSDISFEQGKKLYGDSEKWVSSDFLKDGESMEYGDTGVFLMRNPESHVFYLENIKKKLRFQNLKCLQSRKPFAWRRMQ